MMCPVQLKAMAIGIACLLSLLCVCEGSSLVEPHMTQAPPTLSPAHVRSRLRTNFRASPVSATTTPPRCEYKELMTNLHDRVGILATLDEDQRHRLEVIDKKLDQLVDSNAARMESLKAQQLNFQQRLDSFEHIQRLSRSTLDELKDISRTVRSAPQQYAPLPNSSAGNVDISLTDRLDALATLLTSTALSVRTVQEDVFKLAQAINRQRRLSHRRVPPNLIGQPGAAAFPAYPRLSPPTSCLQYYLSVQGILKLQLTPESESFYVACDGDWTVILNRSSDEINFERGWLDYKDGFGNLAGDFFIGLNKLHALTSAAIHELRIVFEDFDGHVAYAGYSTFAIGSERELYPLSLLGQFQADLSPSAGDSLSYHAGAKFSTIDGDNDNCVDCSCAQRYKGAGWFNNCGTSNIMGQYHQQNYAQAGESGIFWDTFQGKDYSLRRVRMMIRPIGEEEARR
ncbi:fibrinogen C domain-containing protein 1 isoform X2 [Drosophila guanche]|uniref:Blast:Fibrinogen C domain-containing protein 1 n=1 Tax=Drosophila guanche TaxID=7266 RepID=A0A3B0JYU7_DROGU|nr:fibrinogen C domain-containing protein 1 isoform X2 [Drosophila guanche]SPP87245.1 blast:Fibrinogen C domain-containing protein 1 [Drosophila guanche]